MNAEPIHVLMPKVMAAIGAIGKAQTNQQQNFKFRGIDDVMNAMHEPLTKHGVFYVPEVLDYEYSTYTTSKGTGMRNCVLRVKYTFFGPAGDSVAGIGMGEASDSGDKATSKALAMALKYALLQTFCIPTEEQANDDPDGQAHVRGSQAVEERSREIPTSRASQPAPSRHDSDSSAPFDAIVAIKNYIGDHDGRAKVIKAKVAKFCTIQEYAEVPEAWENAPSSVLEAVAAELVPA